LEKICIGLNQTHQFTAKFVRVGKKFETRVWCKSYHNSLIFAYVPKPVDPSRGFINGISQPTVEWIELLSTKDKLNPNV